MILHSKVFDIITYAEGISSVCYETKEYYIIIDHNICEARSLIFDYDLYTQFQNRIVSFGKPVYRFLDTQKGEEITSFISSPIDNIDYEKVKGYYRGDTHLDNTPIEHFFETQFYEAYGATGFNYLQKEYPIMGANGYSLFLDYAVVYNDGNIVAVEENGIIYHHPQCIGEKRYLHQLYKQNLCAKHAITLYRLSSQDLRFPDSVIDAIRFSFGEVSTFSSVGLKVKRDFTLWDHQIEYINRLNEMRNTSQDSTSALIVLPTASGKSQIIIEDIASYKETHRDARILVVAPRIAIAEQWRKDFDAIKLSVDCGTYHMLYRAYREKESSYYDYICIDEAHHAVAPLIEHSLMFLTPKLLVGLTATPDRPDLKKLEVLFGSYNTPLSLEQAIEKKIISEIRAFRVETNLDLSEVRFNGREYHNSDLEKSIRVPSRDRIIASVIATYFRDKNMKGVVFCINIKHAQEMAKILNEWGIKATSVSSKDKNSQQLLDDFHQNKFQFITSCNMLNEGWNEKDISVLVMARPTMSKVLYMQQLGRGLRRTTTKDEVYVVDVVDQYGSIATPWSTHALFKNSCYVPFGNITHTYKEGDSLIVLGVEEKIQSIREVNILSFEEKYPNVLSVEQCARELFISTGTLLKWIKKGICTPDVTLPFGNKQLHFFSLETIQRIKVEKGLKEHNEKTIKEDFYTFLAEKKYTYSFKMVFLKSLLLEINQNGEAELDKVLLSYIAFYKQRALNKLPIDKSSCIYTSRYLEHTLAMKKSMLTNPFEKFERKRFIYYGKDIKMLSINPHLFSKLNKDDILNIIEMMDVHLNEYYESIKGREHE